MRSIRNGIKTAAFVFVAVLFLSQAIRIDRSNPPVRSDLIAGPYVKSILRRACYNCHSNETDWPWYSGIAPASWLVGNDVKEGRRRLNFSEWGAYDNAAQSNKLRRIAEEVQDGEMPPGYYSLVHRDSRLNSTDRDTILFWTVEAIKPETK